MSTINQLISWKTDAWKNADMVAWYSKRMVENTGANRLNNALEVQLCSEHAVGERILDIGIGTGRASLPLARAGKQVTGVDSSQAMLDETRRLAGAVPISLSPGDVLKLPVDDAAFDTAMALNVLTHFPNWQDVLPHWASKVRDGGRLIFDVYSLDHMRAATGRQITEEDLLPKEEAAIGTYNLRISVESLAKFADRHGLAIVAVVPYRSFLGGTDANLLLTPNLGGLRRWERFLSWLAEDDALFDLACFLERAWMANMTSRVAGKLMIVLDKRSDIEGNRRWLERNAALNDILFHGQINAAALQPVLKEPVDALRTALEKKLSSLRNRAFFFRLAYPLISMDRCCAEDFIPASVLAELRAWARNEKMDAQVTRMIEDWGKLSTTNLEYSTAAIAYPLARILLQRHFGRFTGKNA